MTDNLTRQQRSYCMSRVKNKNTNLEILVRSALHRKGFRFRKNVKYLPGKPDIVFERKKIAIFIDGDFWHGYRFPRWCNRLSPFWQNKIMETRRRDKSNFAKLRYMGYKVLRLWQHSIKTDLDGVVDEIVSLISATTT